MNLVLTISRLPLWLTYANQVQLTRDYARRLKSELGAHERHMRTDQPGGETCPTGATPGIGVNAPVATGVAFWQAF